MRFLPSPHFNERPDGTAVDLIVLHAISLPPGEFGMQSVADFFMGTLDTDRHPGFADLKGSNVSAHFVVDRKGAITQFVPLSKRAWHAGASSWEGRDNCNDYAIGIEMIGDEKARFTQSQYRETARLCRVLMAHFPDISRQRIVGHQDVAPDRKWDPGRQWQWLKFYRSFSRIRKLNIEVEV
ncbi:MAG: 1,6-anhydro-N-acetylmuramyl-L-alanine amidase AmpD [Mariprofundaceae bacterium]|nr:1,6-anhydro-N-acetylmuramyl-L-alanine amidase AmpD [Mariprofundaceae bacterium]